MGRGREGSPRRLERVGWIAGHAEDVLSAFVVRGKIGITERPIHAESVEARRPESVLGESMGLPLIVQRRPPEPEDPFVSERLTARPRLGHFTRPTRGTEVRITLIQQRTLLEHDACVASGDLRVSECPRTELPVRVIHREIPGGLEAPPTLEKQDAHPGLGEAHRGESSAGPRADDHRIECFLFGGSGH
jgi:hypothetical protein